MILIFSISTDYTTYEVMKWLHYLGHQQVVRINADELKETSIQVIHDKFKITLGDEVINSEEIGLVWYRKGLSWFKGAFQEIKVEGHDRFTRGMNNIIGNENTVLLDYLHFLIKDKVTVLGSAFNSNLNKLITLRKAEQVGLKVPKFMVSDQKSDFEYLLQNKSDKYITKAMSDGIYVFDSTESNRAYFTYTEQLDEVSINRYSKNMPPSFVQKMVEKKYEVRVFYLDGCFYSWAIMSQNDEQTQVDYRKYNSIKPNRNLAYLLPKEIKNKLLKLFEMVELNTGSVDLMVDQNDDYYFLEINPVGQFGQLSKSTNYQLEKKIAEWMINHEK